MYSLSKHLHHSLVCGAASDPALFMAKVLGEGIRIKIDEYLFVIRERDELQGEGLPQHFASPRVGIHGLVADAP